VWGLRLLSESIHILLESTPRGISIKAVERELLRIKGVKRVHDMHVWELASNMYAMTAHVVAGNITTGECAKLAEKMNSVLERKFTIGHTNFQFEEK